MLIRQWCTVFLIGLISLGAVNKTSTAQSAGHRGLIAFTSLKFGGSVYVMDANGNNLRLLTAQYLASSRPAWSPDGKQIAFSPGQCKAYLYDTCFLDLTSNHVHYINLGEEYASFPAYSPDGKYIAFTSANEIYVADAKDGKHKRRVTYNSPLDSVKPSWSPDSTQIVFELQGKSWFQIDIIDVDGKGQHRIIPDGNSPAWSPDGKSIAFAVGSSFDSDIYLVDTNGKNRRQLTHAKPGSAGAPTWSPDSTQIAYEARVDSSRGGLDNFRIYIVNADGSNPHNISPDPYLDWDPAWSLADVNLPPNLTF